MSGGNAWRVYGSIPTPVTCRSRRAARRLARRWARLGIRATLFEEDEARGWVKRARAEAQR